MSGKDDRIGALWRPNTQNGKAPVAKGSIEINGQKIPVVVWRNRWKKEGERTPDFYIERDTPRDQSAPRQEQQPPAVDTFGRGKPDDFSDDIPF